MFSFLRPSFSETNVSAVGFCCCAGWQALTQPPKQPSVSAGLGCRATLWSTLQAHQKPLYTLICFVSFIDITNTSIIISVTNFLRNSYPCAVNCTNHVLVYPCSFSFACHLHHVINCGIGKLVDGWILILTKQNHDMESFRSDVESFLSVAGEKADRVGHR